VSSAALRDFQGIRFTGFQALPYRISVGTVDVAYARQRM
jgi:hypothetical protein